ncbi:MAG: glycosyltransferase family 2 protein [Lentisphaerae bacterium]|nr:glycosyltransferase family 2 protein [Lentisphaerota bacterium]MCP4100629.1 glycosyltransferase family 2 protein [Lentisphaerota bacterium]
MGKVKVCVIVPCFNEADNVVDVIDDILSNVSQNEGWEVIAINDCSNDDTLSVLENDKRTTILDLPCNLGVGAAVQAGFKYAVSNDFDYAFKFDGDGQHMGSCLNGLLDTLKKNEADFVVGLRFINKNNQGFQSTPLRRAGIHFFRFLIGFLSGYIPSDPTSGLRGYNKKAIKFAARYYPSFDYPEPEELLLLKRNGFKMRDIYTEMRERQGGESSISPFRSVYYMLKVAFAILMVALRPKEKEC